MADLLPPADEALLLTYFTGNGESGLRLAASDDGYVFRALRRGRGLWTSQIGAEKLVRDPCACRGPDGTYHLVWTTGRKEPCFGYARTRDFRRWGRQKLIEPWRDVPGVVNCRAPEVTFDPELGHFLVYWASTPPGQPGAVPGDDGDHRIYAMTTLDFVAFSPATLLFDPGFNVIDASIVRDDVAGRWLMFVKDDRKLLQRRKHLFVATSETIEGPYVRLGEPFGGKSWAEGPTAIKLGARWFCWFDRHAGHACALMTSADLKTWEDESDAISLPTGVRHFAVLRVPRGIIEGIDAAN